MSLVRNERVKLTANWLNALAAGIVVTGAIAPLVAALYGVPGPAQASPASITVLTLVWVAAGIALHLSARRLLGRLLP